MPVDDHRGARSRVVREQDPPAGQRLWVGRVRHRRLERPEQPARPAEEVDPGAVDLRDEDAPVGERRVAVDGSERPRRIVDAGVRAADLTHDPVVPDEEDATAVGVCDRERPVRHGDGMSDGRDNGQFLRLPDRADGCRIERGRELSARGGIPI